MKKNFLLTLVLLAVALFTVQPTVAQAPEATPEEAITALLNRIGGDGAANKFEIVIDETLDDANGKDVFVITAQNGKPCIKGNNQLSVATGINWYLNHYAHINLTWNKLSTDLVNATLPIPDGIVTKECAVDLRYYLNYCTYSYTCAMWTEERWMQEIDWMALHGINMPLMLVGLDCVWYDLYTKAEYGYNYTAEEISNYIAGPAFQAWWGMINCEGHGGPNPAWWYERSRALATNMLARMRSFGMEPVLPGFCGEVPSNLGTKLGGDSEINTGGYWQGFPAPGLMGHKSAYWATLAQNYYDALEGVMGTSKYYSMDPFHEGATGLTGNSSGDVKGYFQSCYAQMKANVGEGVVWVAQDWDSNPKNEMLTGLNKGELIVLDLFAEADPHYSGGYSGHDYIYCMLLNFGGRVGLHGRFNKTIDGYYAALAARRDEMVGIGATPEGAENNPMLYDILFELPWRETAPDKTEWINEYTVARYGAENATVKSAYAKLMNSVYNCTTGQQGTSEPIICAIPSLTATKVSSWASAAVDYDHEIVIAAADEMLSQISEFDATNDNFNYDLLDVVRQALTNYSLDMLAQLNRDYNANGFDATFSARKDHYLALIEDIDELLGTHQKFRLGNWAEMARAIVTETAAADNGAGETDADWLEYDNLRRQITTWANFISSLRDYSNREWNGLVKDYYLERWKIFFNALENGTTTSLTDSYWYNYGNTYVYDKTKTYSAAPVGDTRTVARSSFDKYFLIDTDDEGTKVYFSRHIEQSKAANEYVKYAYRGEEFTFDIPEGTTATLSVDANNDGVFGDGETVSSNTMTIPEGAATTTVKALVVLSDNTEISFYLFIADNIDDDRTVTVKAGDNGSVAIEGTNESSITNSEYVTMTATANSGYEFSHWVQVAGDGVETEAGRENPFTYLGKAEATFKAYFIENIWGIPGEDRSDWSGDADLGNKQYLTSITCVQEENETVLFTANAASENFFVPVGTMINAAKGSHFTINWQGDGNMKYCYLSAYIDFNKDGDFEDDGELLMVKGTLGYENTAVETGPLTILLPLDMPIGITHIRLRFDGAWKSGYDATTKAFPAKNTLNRRCYEIVLNVTEHAATSSHIVIQSNNEEWGTVRNITGVTGTDIDVPAGTEICMDAFPKEGYEFVHWLDKYGRIVSTDASFYYTPCESGEFTAVFKKIAPETIEVGGWTFKYRTEPGSMVTNKLASGVKPENGKTYYIYAPTCPTNDGDYVNRYLYNNSGTLSLNTAASGDNYLWTCSVDGENYTFQNVGDPTKYLAHKATAASPYNFTLGTGTTCYEGITIYSVADSRFFVINDDGSGFNQSQTTHNQSTDDYTTDFVFVEVSYPDNVILTKVRQSGNHDLVIPETVEILGEQCTIIGFDNGLFANNKDLWTITLPSTIESVSSNVVFCTSFNGTITPEPSNTNKMNSSDSQIIDLGGYALENNKVWTLDVEFESDGSLYNKWGNVLLAGGEDATTNQWLYLTSADNGGAVHLRVLFGSLYVDNGTNYFKDLTSGKTSTFKVSIANQGNGTAIVTVTNSEGTSSSSSAVSFSPGGVTKLSTLMPTGVNITSLEIKEGPVPDPFEGCTNLIDIKVTTGCDYYVTDRKFYSPDGTMLHALASEVDAEKIRALGELIDLTETLIEEVAVSVNPTGKATALSLTTTVDNDYFVSTNADQNTGGGDTDGAGIAGLVDNNTDTHFHSRWGGDAVNAPHHIQIDLGDGKSINVFKFSYVAHNAPDPTTIVVSGSNDGTNFTPIETITKDVIAVSSTYTSKVFESATAYRYLRFAVTASSRSGYGSSFGNYYCFGMKEFDLYKVTSTAEVAPKYKNLAGVTNEETAIVYDSMAEALYFYNNGGTAAELQAAYDELKPLYDALNAKKDKVFEGVYNINFGDVPVFMAYLEAVNDVAGADVDGYRLFDGLVEHEGANDGQTNNERKEFHQSFIDAKAPADALFMVVPNADYTAYNLSVQGYYLENTKNDWLAASVFNNDKEQAGVYLFEDTNVEDVYRLKCVEQDNTWLPYINDWGYVFGNNDSNEAYATFTLTPVTEYTLNVPESGFTTLCLPFNVVLPAGVTAYDLAGANITTAKRYSTYELVTVAAEGDILAKNTPVIIKADANDYTLTITMNDEGAKCPVENSLLRSGIVKTTLADGNNYTFDGENFNRVAEGTEIAANQCYMALDENLGDIIYGEAPVVVLTTDEENPVLYNIYHKRTGYVMSYDSADDKVDIIEKEDNNIYQAWYFMEGTDGAVIIKPYNGNGKLLGANDTSNGNNRLLLAIDATYKNWTIELAKETDSEKYYFIKTNGTFVNDYSNETDNIGFWNGANASIDGSLFKLVDAEFTNDNARYYQLSDLRAKGATTYYKGESVGLYSTASVEEYNEKYNAAATTADALIAAGSATSASDDCYAAYKALRNADEGLVYNAPDANKVYYIISTATNDYCAGKYVHTYSEPHLHQNATWGDKPYDQSHLLFDAEGDIEQLSLAAFQFEETGTMGEYKMKNLHTGLYVNTFAKDETHMGAEDDAAVVKIAGIADGQVTLKIGNNSPMHAQNDYSVIVTWDAASNNPSTWTINEVPQEDLNEIYALAVPESGVTTLNLAFNVVLPAGVVAYDFAEKDIVDDKFTLTEVASAGDVLAKNTPVVIKAAAGKYNLRVTLSDENVKGATTGSVLSGNYWQTTVGTAVANYLPGVDGRNFIFNYVSADDTTVPANTVWATLTAKAADIIYDNAEPRPVFELPVVGKVYRIKSFVSNVAAEHMNHYLVNGSTGITFSTVVADDKSDMWICTGVEDETNFTFASALANAALGWKTATEDAVEFAISGGYEDGAVTLNYDSKNLGVVIDNAGNATFTESDIKTQSTGWSTDWYLESVENAGVSFATAIGENNKWATMYLPFAVNIPDSVEVYYAESIDGSTITLTEITTGVIPANTAVLLYRENDANTDRLGLDFGLADVDVDPIDGENLFDGKIMTTAISAAGARVYLLVKYNGKEKFYWMQDEYNANCAYVGKGSGYVKCDANKAYLRIEESLSPVSSYSFRFNGTTGIEDVEGENGDVKAIYDLQGRKLSEITEPGIYIINGKRVLIK